MIDSRECGAVKDEWEEWEIPGLRSSFVEEAEKEVVFVKEIK